MTFWEMVALHVIAAIPPTVAAGAALVTSLRAAKHTREIHILVNGERSRLMEELAAARAALARKDET